MTPRQSAAVARLARADTRFFKTHPDRRHRIRLAHPAELALIGREIVPPGLTLLTAIRQLLPGVYAHAHTVGQPGRDEASEAEASALFERASLQASALH
ncbi:hypothetical protein [Bradyrhizobium sp. OK095]|uniref:hypothetical protein n=1 Tax=Bradyrhizobium sp. OK095 TaxID=1882760 RepID=UPI000B823DE2|nr:hypothetical protein [Bradyrhizobium sp. OK095]